MVERGWSEEFVMNLPHYTRKAIIGVSLQQNENIDKSKFNLDNFINRESYFSSEEEKEAYFKKYQIKIKKQEIEEQKQLQKIYKTDEKIDLEYRVNQILNQLKKTETKK